MTLLARTGGGGQTRSLRLLGREGLFPCLRPPWGKWQNLDSNLGLTLKAVLCPLSHKQ